MTVEEDRSADSRKAGRGGEGEEEGEGEHGDGGKGGGEEMKENREGLCTQRLQASLLTLPTPSGRGNAAIEKRMLGCWGLQAGSRSPPPPLPALGAPW